MPFIGPVEDRLAIRELFGAYSDATSRGDREAWLACWSEDCRWINRLFDRSGKAELSAQWDTFWKDYAAFAFMAEIGAIEVSGETARARATTREIIRLNNGTIQKFSGRYQDELVRRDGQWLFQTRRFDLLIGEPAIGGIGREKD